MSVLGDLTSGIGRGLRRGLAVVGGPFAPFGPNGSAASFEAGGYGRRLENFRPAQVHINAAITAAGRTLIKRARFLVENNGYAGNAVDAWAAWTIGEGIRPRITNEAKRKTWKKWAREADADRQTNFYGLQEKAVREAYIAGEVFVRRRARRPGDMRSGIPFQLQILQAEMLDLAYNVILDSGNIIRMGIEFDKLGRRVAYHFWKHHPDDYYMRPPVGNMRVRVPAEDVIHLVNAPQGGQIRGVSKFTRAIVKMFMLDSYDDAELDRKRTASLLTAFIKKVGEQNPIDDGGDDDADDDDNPVRMAPGATVGLLPGEDVTVSSPAESGASYEPFQFRQLLQISVGLGIPYAYLTGDTTKGNFSNVRTEIMNFRRRVLQYQRNTFIPQFCDRISDWIALATSVPTGEEDSEIDADDDLTWLLPKMEWVDPLKDVKADMLAVRAGFRTMDAIIGENGQDREEVFEEIEESNKDADKRGLILDSDPRYISQAGMSNAMPPGSGFAAPGDEILDPADNNDNSVLDPEGSDN